LFLRDLDHLDSHLAEWQHPLSKNMKILIVGSGGREHAVAWAIRRTSTEPVTLYCASGNAGIGAEAQVIPISAMDLSGLAAFARSEKIDLTFVGPEAPLAAGLVDRFEASHLPIVGPHALAARLEGSKVFAKDFMARHNVPTAAFGVAETYDDALLLLKSGRFGDLNGPVVVKADGLAAGKGVVVADSHGAAEQAIEDLMIKHSAGAEAASRIVLEEMLVGTEASLLLFADGKDYVLMPAARDHKRIGENDTGPNTGGMGTITDSSILSESEVDRVVREIVEPTLVGAEQEGFPFKGILFLGLMLTADGPQLLEYNVRFGDPETQAILVRLQSDLVAIFDGMRRGTLGTLKVDWAKGSSACVVAASEGYPGTYETGSVIQGLHTVPDNVQVFHAGTALSSDGKVTTSGGRVLGVTSSASKLSESLANCYAALEKIHWPGMQFRRDIGKSATSQHG
jgi:phosphoribosylamine--glycine ligase